MKADPEPTRRARRGHGRPTLHDVALAADVTRITVSRFLREPHVVAEATATRIRDAIAQTGYVPNRQAGQLASARSQIVAALIPNVGHSIFAETIQGLSEGLRGSGHELLLASTGYSMEREEAQLRALLGWAPAALIVTGRHHTPGASKLLRDAQAAGTPVVEIWDDHAGAVGGFAQIGFDHDAVGRAMARHLLARGHRSLVYVDSGVSEDFRAHERGEGFAAEARAAAARVKTVRAATGDPFDAGRRVLQALREKPSPRFTAIAFANDHLACGALMAAHAAGVDVPDEVALLGFGDFPIGAQLQPALSTVRPPRDEIGRAAAAAVLASVSTGTPVQGQALPWELIARESTFAPSPAPARARGPR
jgi:LacI family transcriptional regulator, gluconate utilization system Gnt-I transcriptional repressor